MQKIRQNGPELGSPGFPDLQNGEIVYPTGLVGGVLEVKCGRDLAGDVAHKRWSKMLFRLPPNHSASGLTLTAGLASSSMFAKMMLHIDF